MKTIKLLAMTLVLVGPAVGCPPSGSENNADRDKAETQLAAGTKEALGMVIVDDNGAGGRPRPIFWDLAFSPDSKYLLSASQYGVVLWDLERGKAIGFMENSQGCSKLALSPDGKWLLGPVINGIAVWEVSTGNLVSVLNNKKNTVNALALSLDKRVALVGGNGPEQPHIRPEEIQRRREYGEPVPGADELPDNLQFWDVGKGEIIHHLSGHRGPVHTVVVSRDGTLGLSAGVDFVGNRSRERKNIIKLWDLQNGKLLRNHELPDEARLVYLSPDNKRFYSLLGTKLKGWDVGTGALIDSVELGKNGEFLTFSPDKRYYLTQKGRSEWPSDGTLTVCESPSGKAIKVLERKKDARGLSKVEFSPNQKLVAISGDQALLQVWDLETEKLAIDLEIPEVDHNVRDAAFLPDGKRLVSASGDCGILLWDLKTGKPLRAMQDSGKSCYCVAVSPDGRFVMGGGDLAEPKVSLWDVESGKLLKVLSINQDVRGSALAFSQDGLQALIGGVSTGNSKDTLQLVDTSTGAIIHRLPGHSNVRSVAFSKDGALGLSTGLYQSVKLWDLKNGRLVREFGSVNQLAVAVCFSEDAKQVFVLGREMQVWDTTMGIKIKSFSPGKRINPTASGGFAYSPDREFYLQEGRRSAAPNLSLPNDPLTAAYYKLFLHNVSNGDVIKELDRSQEKQKNFGMFLRFAPDSKAAILYGGDVLQAWNLETGQKTVDLLLPPVAHFRPSLWKGISR